MYYEIRTCHVDKSTFNFEVNISWKKQCSLKNALQHLLFPYFQTFPLSSKYVLSSLGSVWHRTLTFKLLRVGMLQETGTKNSRTVCKFPRGGTKSFYFVFIVDFAGKQQSAKQPCWNQLILFHCHERVLLVTIEIISCYDFLTGYNKLLRKRVQTKKYCYENRDNFFCGPCDRARKIHKHSHPASKGPSKPDL